MNELFCQLIKFVISNAPSLLAQADRSGNEDTLIVDKRFYSMDSCNKDIHYGSPDSGGDDGRPYDVFLCICLHVSVVLLC